MIQSKLNEGNMKKSYLSIFMTLNILIMSPYITLSQDKPFVSPSALFAENIIDSKPIPFLSLSYVVLPDSERGMDLQTRVSFPVSGAKLPILIFSHGYGLSADDYAPLVNFWASHGFVVIQPTHLDSKKIGLLPSDPRIPLTWKYRVEDMEHILDQLDYIEASVPGLKGRLDRKRIAAVGHSYGGQTVGMLLGVRILDSKNIEGDDMSDPRIKAGVLLSTAGRGGDDLSSFAAENFPFMNPSFEKMTTPTLVVAGDHDISPLTVRGADWFTDPYKLSPGSKCLVTLVGGEHSLGGITGFRDTGTTDEDLNRVTVIQWLTWAYLRSVLYPAEQTWTKVQNIFSKNLGSIGHVECK